MNNYIKIDSIETKNNTLKICFSYDGEIAKFVEKGNDFVIDYDFNIEDIPKSILVIPFLNLWLPVASITNAKLIVDEIDKDFYYKIKDIYKPFNKMYKSKPKLFNKKSIIFNKLVKNVFEQNNYSMFFSGGVDSLNTLCQNIDTNPLLIMIHCSDIWIDDDDGWNTAKENIKKISNLFDKEYTCLRSNFRRTINELELNRWYEEKLGDNWWHGVEHGLALLGHTAPIIYHFGIKEHFIPSTLSPRDKNPKCGSYPTIDEKYCVGKSHTSHDGFKFSRLEKVRNIVNYSKNNNITPTFRTCYIERKGKLNCNSCEKCYRTMMELASLGEDPNKYGYKFDKSTINRIKTFLFNQNFEHDYLKLTYSEIIQEFKKNNYFKKYDDFSWLKDINIHK